jgi:hypothetical protein
MSGKNRGIVAVMILLLFAGCGVERQPEPPITYTIVYNANGGTGFMASSSFTYGVSQSLQLNTFTRSNYRFTGWARAAGGPVEFLDYQNVINLASADNAVITLYAQWEVTWVETSFKEKVGPEGNFNIKGGGSRDWLITTNFDIAGLKSMGYSKLLLTLNFDAKNLLVINVGSRLYGSFWKGHPPAITRYVEKYWTPALPKWEAKNLTQEIPLDGFENKLTIRWGTSNKASFTVGSRTITIVARK